MKEYRIIQFLLFTALILGLHIHVSGQTQTRPNILWITCEDISPSLSMYGDSTLSTPNLDWLAKEGIVYTNMYSASGVCAPSRSAIITGVYPTSIGSHHMRTSFNGCEDHPPYETVPPGEIRLFPEFLRASGYYCTNNAKEDYQFKAPFTVWDESSEWAHWRNNKSDNPFFSVFNFITTHESQIWKRSLDPIFEVRPEILPVAPYHPNTRVSQRDIGRYYQNIKILDGQIGMLLEQLKEDGLLDNTFIFFFSDHGGNLPRQKREIYDSGIKVPFIVRFPDKWKAGTKDTLLYSFVDLAPTMLSIAGIEIPSYMEGIPFLGKNAENKSHKYIYAAADRFDEITDKYRAIKDYRFKYIRNYFPELPGYKDLNYRKQMPMMREMLNLKENQQLDSIQLLWFQKPKPAEELYDTWKDPHEINNLAEVDKYENHLVRLRNILDKHLKKYGDMGDVSEREMVLSMWPEFVQPETKQPLVFLENGYVHIDCETKGASIGWRYTTSEIQTWNVYTGPFKIEIPATVDVVTHRIGYKPAIINELKIQ
ncbi:MAG: sulfatase [bacterium]